MKPLHLGGSFWGATAVALVVFGLTVSKAESQESLTGREC